MCRNIKPLFNFDPPAINQEIYAASLQFARKLSGFATPSAANHLAIDSAAQDFVLTATNLLNGLDTASAPKSVNHSNLYANTTSLFGLDQSDIACDFA